MTHMILVPITTKDVEVAIARAPAIAEAARLRDATVIVLETDCLHGWLLDVETSYEQLELRRIHGAAERVADAVRALGARVETVWECVRGPQRPVSAETVRRHGADAVFVSHGRRRTAFLEQATLRRLRRDGIEVLYPGRVEPVVARRDHPPSWND